MLLQGIVYGKPVHQGISQLKPTKNLRVLAEERVGRACGGLRVLNSYWINQDSTYKYYEVVMVDTAHNAIRNVRTLLQWTFDSLVSFKRSYFHTDFSENKEPTCVIACSFHIGFEPLLMSPRLQAWHQMCLCVRGNINHTLNKFVSLQQACADVSIHVHPTARVSHTDS
jgi:hypothetical protein